MLLARAPVAAMAAAIERKKIIILKIVSREVYKYLCNLCFWAISFITPKQ